MLLPIIQTINIVIKGTKMPLRMPVRTPNTHTNTELLRSTYTQELKDFIHGLDIKSQKSTKTSDLFTQSEIEFSEYLYNLAKIIKNIQTPRTIDTGVVKKTWDKIKNTPVNVSTVTNQDNLVLKRLENTKLIQDKIYNERNYSYTCLPSHVIQGVHKFTNRTTSPISSPFDHSFKTHTTKVFKAKTLLTTPVIRKNKYKKICESYDNHVNLNHIKKQWNFNIAPKTYWGFWLLLLMFAAIVVLVDRLLNHIEGDFQLQSPQKQRQSFENAKKEHTREMSQMDVIVQMEERAAELAQQKLILGDFQTNSNNNMNLFSNTIIIIIFSIFYQIGNDILKNKLFRSRCTS